MGFIEDLRRQIEQEKQQAIEAQRLQERREGEYARLAQIREDKKNKRELEKAERLERDIKKAQEYYYKSDFPRLVKELCAVAQEDIYVLSGVIAPKWIGSGVSLPTLRRSEYSNLDLDEHNVFSRVGISLIWYAGERNRRRIREWGMSGYDVWEDEHNFISIGCDQTGKITLRKSWGDIKLPLFKWLGRPGVQEEALGEAFHNPKSISFRQNDKPSYERNSQLR
jgi:hypothetical protein